jgi:hypothetical protein
MKHRTLPFIAGILIAAVFAEAALHLFPVSTGYDFGAVDSEDPIAHGGRYFHYTYSRDWNFHLENSGTLNNRGFRASYDYFPDPRALAVIGNSYIQADAIDPRDTMTERLGILIGRPAFAVGMDGASLADYLPAARWASDTFGARSLLVLLTTGDLSHSCMAKPGKHSLELDNGTIALSLSPRDAPSRFKRWLNRSKLFRYTFDNLRAGATWTKGWRRNDDSPGDPNADTSTVGCGDSAFESAATQFLLSSFHDLETSHQARVTFVLAPGYRREQHIAAGDIRDIDGFAAQAASAGFAVVHLESAFVDALRSGVRLDFLPIDGHWSAAANAIAARVVAPALSDRHQ